MPSADQVPVNSSHSRMQWPMWVVLIAGSTGSALRAVRPPNLHIAPWSSARSRSDPQPGRIIVSLACSHHCPGHSGELVGQRDGSDFGRPSERSIVEKAVEKGIASRVPLPGVRFYAFTDTAGGSGTDGYTLAIGHRVRDEGRDIAGTQFRPWCSATTSAGLRCDPLYRCSCRLPLPSSARPLGKRAQLPQLSLLRPSPHD